MSISIEWRVTRAGNRLPGTSADWATYQSTFGVRNLTVADCPMLDAMHKASCLSESLWSSLSEALIGLPEGAEIEVWAEF